MIQTEVIEITLKAGQNVNARTPLPLPSGKCKRVGLALVDGVADKNVNIAILDNSGQDIVKAHSYKFWEQRQGGDHLDSLKPVDFNCGRNIIPTVYAPTPLAADITFQFVFYIH